MCDDTPIQRVDKLKYLGIEINENCKDSVHIEKRKKLAQIAVAKLKNLEILSEKTCPFLKGHLLIQHLKMSKKNDSPTSKKTPKGLKSLKGLNLQPTPPPKSRFELTRTCKITKNENGETKEYTICFDELEKGDFLGRGQFGTVKKMFHQPTNLTFAVKMVNDTLMESNDSRNSEIMDLAAPLKIGDGCPSLIKFYGAMHAESYIWILTEVMDTSLDRFYAKVFAMGIEMPELFVSKVAYAVTYALDFMRKAKMMHRDIKPSNILLNYTGEIKVCDFGISGFTTNSVCTTFKGCQRYMPVITFVL
ncbi:unnamed protein product [Brachionus calyciflorus]|uniref:mitogen-activated protein kinase kinase n=1 Tax=Brachionus calyciflorus TaxID=104777 RepID=A0A814FEC8_9BILA|nr:unnamed protein product [Brachionus calyciflorus]